jgi:hypothetical protein
MGDNLVREIITDRHGWTRFRLNETEARRLSMWIVSHFENCPKRGDDIRIAQSGKSGIGVNTVIRCACGAGSDITDYGS